MNLQTSHFKETHFLWGVIKRTTPVRLKALDCTREKVHPCIIILTFTLSMKKDFGDIITLSSVSAR